MFPKALAERQKLSLKYIERIMPVLSKNNLAERVHGEGGGYRLTRNPSKYKIREILHLIKGDLAPTACLECVAEPCERTKECKPLPMWSKFHSMVIDCFDSISLENHIKPKYQTSVYNKQLKHNALNRLHKIVSDYSRYPIQTKTTARGCLPEMKKQIKKLRNKSLILKYN